MRKFFITGLVLLLPLAFTIVIVVFVVNKLTAPFVGLVSGILSQLGIFEKGFLFLTATQLQIFLSEVLILILLFFFTVFLGFLTRWVFTRFLIRWSDYVFHRIPFVRAIYKTTQDVMKTIFTSETKSFKQVVLVPFPNPQAQSVGLVTREGIEGKDGVGELIAVFVPTTPNPTSGFLMMFKPEDLVFLDMSVEEALKYIISLGVIQTPLKHITREEAHRLYEESE